MIRGASRAGIGSSDPAGSSDPMGSTFMRGLAIGVLVGGVIAGSALWEELRSRRHRDEPDAVGRATAGVRGGRWRRLTAPDRASHDQTGPGPER